MRLLNKIAEWLMRRASETASAPTRQGPLGVWLDQQFESNDERASGALYDLTDDLADKRADLEKKWRKR